MTPCNLSRFFSSFPDPEYYRSPEPASEDVKREGQFNIIHPASGLKVDVFVKKADEFDESRFLRKRSLPLFPDRSAFVASPEDVILRKMEYYRDGGSEKHLRDISGIIKVTGREFDLAYIERWASRKDLPDMWRAILSRTKGRE